MLEEHAASVLHEAALLLCKSTQQLILCQTMPGTMYRLISYTLCTVKPPELPVNIHRVRSPETDLFQCQ